MLWPTHPRTHRWLRRAVALTALLASGPLRGEENATSAASAPGDAAWRAQPQSEGTAEDLDAELSESELRYTLDDVLVEGNTKTETRVILRYLPFSPGSQLDVDDDQLRLTRYRLLGTGFFRDVALSLEKGTRRGHVILRVVVEERNTFVVNDIWMGLAASADSDGRTPARMLSPFAGLSVAENNLLGTGITLGAASVFSDGQRAMALRFLNPAPLNSRWMLSSHALLSDGLGFFGNSVVQWDNPRLVDEVPRQAVVEYRRLGGDVGVGRELSLNTELWFNYRAEAVLAWPPDAAAHEYGGELESIDFHVHRGHSVLTSIRATLNHDTRDAAVLPTKGISASASADVSLAPFGSDYPYQRLDLSAQKWWPLGHDHVFRLSGYAGAIAGYAPFFERIHISDLSDFRPGRILGLAFDDRPAPNFLGTSISEVRYGDFALRVEGQYRIPLYRGTRSIYGIDVFVSAGALALAEQRTISRPPRNRSGFESIPVDLTSNIGLQVDTRLGGITLSFANVLGFIPFGSNSQ